MDAQITASNIDSTTSLGTKRNCKYVPTEANTRQQGVVIVKPIIYGSVSRSIGVKRDDGHTHQWTVYLKSYTNEDMSSYVKKVQFRLHNSYAEPNRVYFSPPYTVVETGWGEFEIAIKIFFVDSCERPVTVYHFLKLFARDQNGAIISSNEPQISEFYDELVFTHPTLRMFRQLTHPIIPYVSENTHKTDYEEKKKRDLKKILEAKLKVKGEICDLKARLTKARKEIGKLKSIVEE